MAGGGGIHGIQVVLLMLLVLVAAFAVLAQRLKTPYPIVLVLAGLLLGFVPHVPRVPLNPDLVFLVFLPPLLYASAWQTSWREFRTNLVSIVMLAVGLVAFTVIGVALFSDHVVSALDFKSGFVLGAVVATTDAIAAAAIAKKVGLPARIVEILEGESLLNDATGLLALEFGVHMLQTGETPTVAGGLLRLLWLIAGGIGVGLLIGVAVAWLERWVDDGPVEMVISLVVPYAAYLAGEQAHASGVLAVVACGLYVSRKSAGFFSPETRLQVGSGWQTLDFVLNGLVFLLIGLQLPYVLASIQQYSLGTLVKYGVGFSLILIALRMVWMFPASWVAFMLRRHVLRQDVPVPGPRQIFVVGWTGMRGVIALAAALSLPETLSDGRPFEQRSLILFLTFCVILVTLVLQGLSLPLLIRWLGLAAPESRDEEMQARQQLLRETILFLEQGRSESAPPRSHAYDDMLHLYRHQLTAVQRRLDAGTTVPKKGESVSESFDLITETTRVQREAAVRLRDEGRIGDGVLNRLLGELDMTEARQSSRR